VAKAVARQLRETFSRKSAIEETVSQEDVADCAVFLASDFSRKITGQVIHVDCGLSSSLIL
jgi:enoyl-[acyl-carrier protein] reductase I